MRINKIALVFSVTAALLSACSSTEEKTDLSENEGVAVDKKTGTPAATTGYSDNRLLSGKELASNLPAGQPRSVNMAKALDPRFNDPANLLSKQTIYFMYDSSQIQQDYIAVVAAHAQYLLSHPEQRVILEGHADERGSREYNIALGEQRAKSVYRMMKVQGVADSQLEVVSFGEEKPAAKEMNEASWQLNRRVEIAYMVR